MATFLPGHFAHIHKIAQGIREPDLDLAVAMERELGIRVESWPKLRPAVKELLRLRGVAA